MTAGRDADVPVAAFDLDGTLTVRDTIAPFLAHLCGTGALLRAAALHPWVAGVPLGVADRDAAKRALLRSMLPGVTLQRLERASEEHAARISRWTRPATMERLEWHRSAGHTVVLVTAAFEAYAAPLGRRLGVDAVLGTRLEVDARGDLTGELQGENCRGAEKVRRLDAWLDGRRPRLIWAYGDSDGDRELLAAADVPQLSRRGDWR